jgi:hypothetical protein
VRERAGARDRDGVLGEQPGERELRRRDAEPTPTAQRRIAVAVGGEVLAPEARMVGAEVLVRRADVDRAGEEPRAERRPRHEPDPELAQHRQQLALGVARPQRVLALDRGERMRLVRRQRLLGGHVGHAQVPHLALRDQLAHRADALLDRHARVREVQVPEVERVDAEPAQARLRGLPRALGLGVDADVCSCAWRTSRPPARTIPHLVASWTCSRRPAIALATSRLFAPSA